MCLIQHSWARVNRNFTQSYFRNLNVLKGKEAKDKVYNQLRSHNAGPAILVTNRIGGPGFESNPPHPLSVQDPIRLLSYPGSSYTDDTLFTMTMGLNAEGDISLKDRTHAYHVLWTSESRQPILQLHCSVPNQALSTLTTVTIGQFQVSN